MADDLVERCSKLTIINEEEDIVVLEENKDDKQDEKISLRLIGRVLTEKPLNFDAFKRTMLHVWSLKEGVVIRSMGSNMFMFQFFHWRDMEKVLHGRPWSFEQRLLVLQEIEEDVQPSEVVLKYSPFWVRFYNLPFSCRSDNHIRAIAKVVGECMETEEDFLDVNPYRRVRIIMDVTKPLKRYQLVKTKNGTTVKIPIKYERLPHFCFLCGLMTHTEKNCTWVAEEEKERAYGWGLELKASARKGLHKQQEELENLKLKKTLFVSKPKAPTIEHAQCSMKSATNMHSLEGSAAITEGLEEVGAASICDDENRDAGPCVRGSVGFDGSLKPTITENEISDNCEWACSGN
ncbi:unnamed protein product [Amaranthus hypochondriacus]